jgi:hypothetical protein
LTINILLGQSFPDGTRAAICLKKLRIVSRQGGMLMATNRYLPLPLFN